MTITLYDYFRSSACYRVRIALNLKGLAYETVETSLLAGDHQLGSYKAMNPQGFVPMLTVDGVRLTQSLAIIEWLDTIYPEPRFIPADPTLRAHNMAMALTIACDIHPINNLRVLKRLGKIGVAETVRDDWYRHWISEGFTALEAMADAANPFLGGDAPGIADILLVPQMANARRFNTPLDDFPTLMRIDAACSVIDAFARAHPDAVKPPVVLADG
ncbi:MAG: maleylacetoacetate isomerase [Sphingomonadaceae bacterium]